MHDEIISTASLIMEELEQGVIEEQKIVSFLINEFG